ncbi:MAG: hypothetical protein ACQCXQ_05825 [Verrucomicrobiales bacterium]|nr:hypothetical protein [Verrucomicrobiota bacterium JB025]
MLEVMLIAGFIWIVLPAILLVAATRAAKLRNLYPRTPLVSFPAGDEKLESEAHGKNYAAA